MWRAQPEDVGGASACGTFHRRGIPSCRRPGNVVPMPSGRPDWRPTDAERAALFPLAIDRLDAVLAVDQFTEAGRGRVWMRCGRSRCWRLSMRLWRPGWRMRKGRSLLRERDRAAGLFAAQGGARLGAGAMTVSRAPRPRRGVAVCQGYARNSANPHTRASTAGSRRLDHAWRGQRASRSKLWARYGPPCARSVRRQALSQPTWFRSPSRRRRPVRRPRPGRRGVTAAGAYQHAMGVADRGASAIAEDAQQRIHALTRRFEQLEARLRCRRRAVHVMPRTSDFDSSCRRRTQRSRSPRSNSCAVRRWTRTSRRR